MVIDRETLNKIKKIIENNYNSLIIDIVGRDVFTPEELAEMEAAGIDTSNTESLLELIYYNHILNESGASMAPTSISEMRAQQKNRPKGTAHQAAEEHLNENFEHLLDKLKSSTISKFEGLIRDNNHSYRNNALQNLDRPEDIDQLIKESTVGQLKQTLRDASGDLARDFERIAATETSNAIGLGAADRIIIDNKDKDSKDVYVYRVPVEDAALCKYCRKFYLDDDGTPAVHRLSDLLNNGSNYGKKTSEWKPVLLATHPNERCSGILELRPGWKVGKGGSLEFIGYDHWESYIEDKVR